MLKKECFKIRLYETSSSDIFNYQEWEVIKDVLCSSSELEINPTMIVADPFLFVYNDRLYLFYEYKKLESPGVLKMTSTSDLEDWTDPLTVLEESFHLSFPFTFEYEGIVYMIPETSADGSVRLYVANSDLTQFTYKCTLIDKANIIEDDITIEYSDSLIYRHKDIFYLMTSVQRNGVNELQLYCSYKLEGPYKKHPMSPICCSNKYGRNAGSILQENDVLYRLAQDCVRCYGDQIHLFQIDNMSEKNYTEHLVKEGLLPVKDKFFNNGGHQFNYVNFLGKNIIAVDAKEYHPFVFARLVKFLKKRL